MKSSHLATGHSQFTHSLKRNNQSEFTEKHKTGAKRGETLPDPPDPVPSAEKHRVFLREKREHIA